MNYLEQKYQLLDNLYDALRKVDEIRYEIARLEREEETANYMTEFVANSHRITEPATP